MYILGISCYYHDSAAVLIKDGVLLAAAEEERFSRKKHDASFPKRAVNFCLEKEKLTIADVDYVVFYEKPLIKFERLFLTSLATVPKSLTFFRESMKEWIFDKLWVKSHIISQLKIPEKKLLFSEHHLSHLASAFFPSPFSKAAVLSIDGVGEWTTASWGVGNDREIVIKEEINFPNSLGLLYSAFTVFAGFEANEGEYKLMGLAPYGKPKYVEKIKKVLNIKNDGSFFLDQSYFSYMYDVKGIYTKKFLDLFGKPNSTPDEVIPYYADIAASIQKVTEEILIALTSYIHKKTGEEKLCYAGGVALNSKANWEITNKSGFKDIFIQPAAGDSGGALGAALWAYHTILNQKRSFVMNHAYYGSSQTEEQIISDLNTLHVSYQTISDPTKLVDFISDKMTKGKVIGWVQGEFEWGPRALGHRSILADPRSFSMKEVVNSKIKFREAFRPFAPSVLYEKGSDIFAFNYKQRQSPGQFMLYVTPVANKYKQHLGAITHKDGTARPQLVKKEVNPLYHALISAFEKKTDIPVILNTSFNLKGEPIVNTAKEAFTTFSRSGLDILVLHNKIIQKK